MTTAKTLYPPPPVGAFVADRARSVRGIVENHLPAGQQTRLKVRWSKPMLPGVVDLWDVRSGFARGDEVLEVPETARGLGTVLQTRTIGGLDQVYVEFWDAQEAVWLPWQRLKAVAGVRTFLKNNQAGAAERLRLRNLAYALEQWHGNTGALSRLNLDPLPHQIHLVHRILASGSANWLIADDVGLGKTVEVGLLISALRQRGMRRILLVVPAGLTQQWQEELRDKFFMDEFRIYGRDFSIHHPRHWQMENFVIGSVDRFKSEKHLDILMDAGRWDLIVFDEAHRLGRSEYGYSYDTSDRYHLARTLRQRTDHLLLLSGTPHQGRDDRFRALLELLRPGEAWKTRINGLRADPSFLSEMIIRNRKADVTDADGNFIFRGKLTKTVMVESSSAELDFDEALRHYLSEGYRVSRELGDKGRAIGFVMTTYRKLAASSLRAIEVALTRRQERLLGMASVPEQQQADDERYVEHEETQETQRSEFFTGELDLLALLIDKARSVTPQDSKRRYFMNTLMRDILAHNKHEKVLIFTEYRSTQDYLAHALESQFGSGKVSMINGSMSIDHRREAISTFEDDGQFLISTEAGGEGLNLQRRCHIMVNYDLPWNPMRLVQRVGRLYRYGQDKPVVVFNMHVPATLDAHILSKIYERLEEISRDMASVSDTYERQGLQEDILGELVELIDVGDVLSSAAVYTPERSEARLEEALQRAREAAERQNDLLAFAQGFDPNELHDELMLSHKHLQSFALGMCQVIGIEIESQQYDGRVWNLRLPESVQRNLGGKPKRRIAFDRSLTARARDITLLNADDPLLQLMFTTAKSYAFGGHTACVNLIADATLGVMLRWQNEQGVTLRQEYLGLLTQGGSVMANTDTWSRFLEEPAKGGSRPPGGGAALLELFEGEIHQRLRERSNELMYPSSWFLVGAGWGNEPLD